MPARRLEARERHRPGDDARHPRRHRPALKARRPVRREASRAAGPAAETRPLRLDPPQPARGKDFGVAECRAVGLPQAAHSGAGSVASSRPAEARRRRAAARRGVPERPPAPVRVRNPRARVRRQPRRQGTELRRDRPGSASGVPSPATSRLRTSPPSIQHRVNPPACLRTGGGCAAASSSGRPSGQPAASGWRCTRLPSLFVMTRTPASAFRNGAPTVKHKIPVPERPRSPNQTVLSRRRRQGRAAFMPGAALAFGPEPGIAWFAEATAGVWRGEPGNPRRGRSRSGFVQGPASLFPGRSASRPPPGILLPSVVGPPAACMMPGPIRSPSVNLKSVLERGSAVRQRGS